MTGYQSKKAAAQDKLDSMEREALKLALDFVENGYLSDWRGITERQLEVITAIKKALAQPAQDKDHGDALTIAYQSGYYDGKKAALASLEQNFCPLCGKCTWNIHTCTPPQETIIEKI